MARLIARIIGYTKHRTVERSSRLAEDKVCLEAGTQDAATTLTATLFADGSGVLQLTRGDDIYQIIWDEEGHLLAPSLDHNKRPLVLVLPPKVSSA